VKKRQDDVNVDIVPLGTYDAASSAKAIFHVESARTNTWRKLLRYNCAARSSTFLAKSGEAILNHGSPREASLSRGILVLHNATRFIRMLQERVRFPMINLEPNTSQSASARKRSCVRYFSFRFYLYSLFVR